MSFWALALEWPQYLHRGNKAGRSVDLALVQWFVPSLNTIDKQEKNIHAVTVALEIDWFSFSKATLDDFNKIIPAAETESNLKTLQWL